MSSTTASSSGRGAAVDRIVRCGPAGQGGQGGYDQQQGDGQGGQGGYDQQQGGGQGIYDQQQQGEQRY